MARGVPLRALGACTVQAFGGWGREGGLPARLLLQHTAQLDSHCLVVRQWHRHVCHKAANIARELAIVGVALRQRFGVPEIRATIRVLPIMNVPAPITRLRGAVGL